MQKHVRSPIPWIGGKFYSAARILEAFPSPRSYYTYVEPFGGAGHVLFRKPPYHHIEVYNDLNGDLVNFWLMCRSNPNELQEQIDTLPYSRQLHDDWHKELFSDRSLTDIERAVRWFYVLRGSFGGMLNKTKAGWAYAVRRNGTGHKGSTANRLHSAATLFKFVSERLKNVQIENHPFEKVIQTYSSPYTLFYCDPPYVEKEGYYEYKGVPRFSETDHRKLAKLLNDTSAKVAVSYYPHPLIDELYPADKWRRKLWKTYKHIPKTNKMRLSATELLLMNYTKPNLLRSTS